MNLLKQCRDALEKSRKTLGVICTDDSPIHGPVASAIAAIDAELARTGGPRVTVPHPIVVEDDSEIGRKRSAFTGQRATTLVIDYHYTLAAIRADGCVPVTKEGEEIK